MFGSFGSNLMKQTKDNVKQDVPKGCEKNKDKAKKKVPDKENKNKDYKDSSGEDSSEEDSDSDSDSDSDEDNSEEEVSWENASEQVSIDKKDMKGKPKENNNKTTAKKIKGSDKKTDDNVENASIWPEW